MGEDRSPPPSERGRQAFDPVRTKGTRKRLVHEAPGPAVEPLRLQLDEGRLDRGMALSPQDGHLGLVPSRQRVGVYVQDAGQEARLQV